MIPTDPSITKRIAAAIHRYGMVADGDTVLVAVSGGKDSMTLLAHLAVMAPHFPITFNIKAVHIKSDFANAADEARLAAQVADWGIPLETVDVRVIERLKPGRQMNCYWCSTQRRTELLRWAHANGCRSIALGHHLDDIVETLLMNMAYKGEMSTMLPSLKYDKYPQSIIRPLCLIPQADIVAFAATHGLTGIVCQCDYSSASKRREVRAALEQLAGGGDRVRENIFAAMGNVNAGYLPRPLSPGRRGSGNA
jgi:tRNA(Ile)-lysidine synthase TilS/MesJ